MRVGLRAAQLNDPNLRWTKKADRHDRHSDARTGIALQALVLPGATDKTSGTIRPGDDRPQEGETNLSAMGVPTQVQVDTTGFGFFHQLWRMD